MEMRNGRRFHQCFCGNAGFIEGFIKTIDANQRTIEETVSASSNPPSVTPVKEALAPVLGPPAEKFDKRLLR
jgi:hypothetical protein